MDTKTETSVKKTRKAFHSTGIVFGIFLILLGGLLLGKNLGLPNLNNVIISWQMLLIAIGIFTFRQNSFWGFCLILVGGFFIIPRLATVFPASFLWVGSDFVSNYWAILLIAAGIFWIVIPRRKWKRWEENIRFYHHSCKREGRPYTINGEFSASQIFSSGEYIVSEPEFEGGVVKAIFGSSEIDLTKTSLPEGDTYLKLEVIFSGVTFFIPNDWKIESHIESVFSMISDKRRIIEPANPSRRLILVGECLFSGCEIKN